MNMDARCFLAIELPTSIQEHLESIISSLSKMWPQNAVRWVRPDGTHLTLHFLGNFVSDKIVEEVKQQGIQITHLVKPFTLSTGAISSFPTQSPLRIIYLCCGGKGVTVLCDLQANFVQMLNRVGILVDLRPWRPHLTLGRAKLPIAAPLQWPTFPNVNFEVDSVTFFKSTLTPDGPVYERISQLEFQRDPRLQ